MNNLIFGDKKETPVRLNKKEKYNFFPCTNLKQFQITIFISLVFFFFCLILIIIGFSGVEHGPSLNLEWII